MNTSGITGKHVDCLNLSEFTGKANGSYIAPISNHIVRIVSRLNYKYILVKVLNCW